MRRLILTAAAVLAAPFAFGQAPGGPSPEMRAAFQAVRTACQNDSNQYCADKQGREQFQCLRANTDKLSSDCKDALAKLPARRPPAQQPPAQ